MNRLAEEGRVNFMLNRDGLAEAQFFCRQSITAYLGACKRARRLRGRRFAYRFEYLEAAYSMRHLLRTRLSAEAALERMADNARELGLDYD